jgi:hypothetical protein
MKISTLRVRVRVPEIGLIARRSQGRTVGASAASLDAEHRSETIVGTPIKSCFFFENQPNDPNGLRVIE